MSKHPFSADNEAGRILLKWWQGLAEQRGDRAALRRCRTPIEAVFIPAYQNLIRQLQGLGPIKRDRLPAIASLLAHVRTGNENPLAAQMASGDQPKVSELRFRRLLQTDSDELFQALRRTLQLLDHSANPYDLANSVYYWNDTTKRAWAYDYYGKLQK